MGAKNSSSCKSFDFLDGGLVDLWLRSRFCWNYCPEQRPPIYEERQVFLEAFDNIALEPNNTCARVLSPSCKSFDVLDGGLVVEELLLLELLSRAPSTYL